MTKRNVAIFAAAFAFLAALVFAEEVRLLAFGWIFFVGRTFPQASINWEALATAAIVAVVTLCAVDLFSRSILRAIPLDEEKSRPRWHFRWSVYLTLTPTALFVVAYASIALARHVGWLITSP